MMGPIGSSYSQYMRHVSVISGQPISPGFRRLTGCQWDPRDRGVTNDVVVSPLKYCEILLGEWQPKGGYGMGN